MSCTGVSSVTLLVSDFLRFFSTRTSPPRKPKNTESLSKTLKHGQADLLLSVCQTVHLFAFLHWLYRPLCAGASLHRQLGELFLGCEACWENVLNGKDLQTTKKMGYKNAMKTHCIMVWIRYALNVAPFF